MPPENSSDPSGHPQRDQFLGLLSKSLERDTFVKLVLAKYRGPEPDLVRVTARKLTLRGKPSMSFVYSYKTRDGTKNVPLEAAVPAIAEDIGIAFDNAHLLTTTHETQLAVSRKGKYSLRTGRAFIDL